MLKIDQMYFTQNAHGFFSCCFIRLANIMNYVRKNHSLPTECDCTELFLDYKTVEMSRVDISHFFFHYSHDIEIPKNINNKLEYSCILYSYYNTPCNQYLFEIIVPFIKKYFIPSPIIMSTLTNIERLYNINYEKTVAVYYRGTDKKCETIIGSYESYITKCRELALQKDNEELTFIIQTDEPDFEQFFLHNFKSSKLIICNYISTYSRNFLHAQQLLAVTLMMSKCKYIISSASNVASWMVLFRQSPNNVIQQINNVWYHY